MAVATLRYSVYLLYWYKHTDTAAEGAAADGRRKSRGRLVLLYWYKRTDTDAEGAAADGRRKSRGRLSRRVFVQTALCRRAV
jgi:hypothetical protein